MLVLVATAGHQYAVRDVLETRDHPLHGRLFILSYGEFRSLTRLPVATYVFLDTERVTPVEAAQSIARFKALHALRPDLPVLNRPDRIGSRLEVMARLAAAGINDFRLLPADDPPDDLRFPVFLRNVKDHEGPKSALLSTPEELAAALSTLPDRADFGITEYVDARNAEGLHEKRSYMRIGDSLFPSALDASRNWVCKGEHGNPDTVPQSRREMAFLQSDEDRAELARAFDVAGIEYGRADYAIINGRPQVFEINTNPWLEPPERVPHAAREGAELMIARFIDGLTALADAAPTGGPDWIEVPGTVSAARAKLSRREVIHRILRRSGQLHNETRLIRPFRRVGLI